MTAIENMFPAGGEYKMEKTLKDKLTNFDPDFSPNNPVNIEAARQRGWSYDYRKEHYVDEYGYPVADKFGQDLG